MMLVKAGKPVDDFIEQLIPHLEPGDIIIDGGNSLFDDTDRRVEVRREQGVSTTSAPVFPAVRRARVAARASCREDQPAAWPHVKEIFQAVSAKVRGRRSLLRLGRRGRLRAITSRWLHNGIEYGDMQLICEAYNVMRNGLGMSADEMHGVFAEWNKGDSRQLPRSRSPAISSARRMTTARRSSTRSSTPPVRRAPASGP